MKFVDNPEWIEYYSNFRKTIFLLRAALYYSLFRWHYRFGYDFHFLVPGLEVKFACEEALN